MTKRVSVHSAHRIGKKMRIDFNVSTIARLAIVDTLFFGKSLSMHATTCIENFYHNVHLPFDGEFHQGLMELAIECSSTASEARKSTHNKCVTQCAQGWHLTNRHERIPVWDESTTTLKQDGFIPDWDEQGANIMSCHMAMRRILPWMRHTSFWASTIFFASNRSDLWPLGSFSWKRNKAFTKPWQTRRSFDFHEWKVERWPTSLQTA